MSAQDSPHASGSPHRPHQEPSSNGVNPLRRTSDRIEAWWSGFLLAVLLIGLPVGSVSAGLAAYGSAMRTVEAQAAERHQVSARLTSDPGAAGSGAADEKQRVQVSWTGADGRQRTGTALVALDKSAGSTVPIWVDREETVQEPPMSSESAQATGWLVGAMTAVGGYVGLVAARSGMRLALDRSRYARWDAEWDLVEPVWSSRFRR
ncbi:hypothetical protein U9R90_31055 [Streptomyces sp. E11-3]|uniref:Rv1733c family protein n=1 Tax=Streptomyces sp. E11-3 TaxID=3110112 RepID=UPI00397FE4B2